MVGRILMDTGLKISAPGVDVTTATPAQMNFNSDYAQLGMVLQGEASPGWSGVEWTHNVSYGVTFSTPPIVALDLKLSSSKYVPLGPSGLFWEEDVGDNYWYVLVEAKTTQLQFSAFVQKSTGSPANPSFTIRYTVFAFHH